MSIKPVAMIPEDEMQCLIDGHTAIVIPVGDELPDEVCTTLYAIPDTHRVVPVDALNRIMELAGVALVYQPFGTKDRQNFDALMAIIEDKP